MVSFCVSPSNLKLCSFCYIINKACISYCSVLLAQGVPEKLMQEQLGHADISTTQKAYHYNVFDTNEKESIFRNIKIG